jgi:hypothetical protein
MVRTPARISVNLAQLLEVEVEDAADPFELNRFLTAQAPVIRQALQ